MGRAKRQNLETVRGAADNRAAPAPHDNAVATRIDDRRVVRRQRVAVACILLLAAAARTYRIADFSLWLDEVWTIETATARGSPHLHLPQGVIVTSPPELTSLDGAPPWWRIWTSMREMTHPPLYLILLRWWMEAFGTGAFAVRMFSALASLLAVYLLYDVVRLQLGRGAALWAALIMAIAGPQVQFAQEARPYAFLVMLALVAASALVRIERSGATAARLAAFGVALLALMLTHYFAVGTAAALVAYGLLRTHGRDRRKLLLVVAVAAVTFAASWGPFMWGHRGTFSDENTNFLDDAGPGRVVRTLGRLVALPPRLFNEFLDKNLPAIVIVTTACGFAVYLARRRNDLLLWCLWLAGTIGVVVLLDLTRSTRHLHLLRYSLLASPALYAIAASLTWHADGRTRHALPAVLALACALTLPSARVGFFKANWERFVRNVREHVRPGDVLVFAGDEPLYARSAYLCVSHYTPARERPAFALVTGRADDALVAQLKSAPGVLMVTGMTRELSPHLAILGGGEASDIIAAAGAGALIRVTWPNEKSDVGVPSAE